MALRRMRLAMPLRSHHFSKLVDGEEEVVPGEQRVVAVGTPG